MNNLDLNKLAEKARTDDNARWRLGELLHRAELEGKQVVTDKKNRLILIKER